MGDSAGFGAPRGTPDGAEPGPADGADDDAQWEWPSAGGPPRHSRVAEPAAPVTEPLSGAEVEFVEWIAGLGIEDVTHEQWASAYPTSADADGDDTDLDADGEAGDGADPDAELDAGLDGLLAAGAAAAADVETDDDWQETRPPAGWREAQAPAGARDAEPAQAPRGEQETQPFDPWRSGAPSDDPGSRATTPDSDFDPWHSGPPSDDARSGATAPDGEFDPWRSGAPDDARSRTAAYPADGEFDAWHSGPPDDTRRDTGQADLQHGAEAAGGRPYSGLAGGDGMPGFGVAPAEREAPRRDRWTEEFTAAGLEHHGPARSAPEYDGSDFGPLLDEPEFGRPARGGAEYADRGAEYADRGPGYGGSVYGGGAARAGSMPAGPMDDPLPGAPPNAPSTTAPRGALASQMSQAWRNTGTEPGRKRRVPPRYVLIAAVVVLIASIAAILGVTLSGGPDNPVGTSSVPSDNPGQPAPVVDLPSESASESPSVSPSTSASVSTPPSPTPSRTPKASPTARSTPSRSPSRSPSKGPSKGPNKSPSPTPPQSPSPTPSDGPPGG